MTEPELKSYYNTFTDCWKLLKEYHDIGQAVEYDSAWDEVRRRADGIYQKYKTGFARKLALMTVCELEEISRRKENL